MKSNIFLIGFMGAGKSTIARELCRQENLRLIEMDEQIEAQEQRSIPEIFAAEGEAYFRKLETNLLESLAHTGDTVVSCGGGAVLRRENVDAMRKSGIVVYLDTRPETVFDRVQSSHNRPLLEGNMNVAYIQGLMDKRLPAYREAADVTVSTDGRSAQEICAEIKKAVQSYRSKN